MPISYAKLQIARTNFRRFGDSDPQVVYENGAEEKSTFEERSKAYKAIIRLLEFPDRTCAARRMWLDQVLLVAQVHKISSSNEVHYAQASKPFKMMLISGDDISRVLRVIRDIRQSLPNKILIPVVSCCVPGNSAHLLNSGADDVFHLGMSKQEAEARLNALNRRLNWRQEADYKHAKNKELALLTEQKIRACLENNVTDQQFAILKVLWNSMNNFITPRTLQVAGSMHSQPMSKKALHVAVHLIRRKIKQNYIIETGPDGKYRLTCL